MRTNTFSTFKSLDDFVLVQELAKIRAHQMRRKAVDRFWGVTFAWVFARLGRKPSQNSGIFDGLNAGFAQKKTKNPCKS